MIIATISLFTDVGQRKTYSNHCERITCKLFLVMLHLGLYSSIYVAPKRKIPEGPAEEPIPATIPEVEPPLDPEEPLPLPDDPDFIPEELPDFPFPEELPPPGEAP